MIRIDVLPDDVLLEILDFYMALMSPPFLDRRGVEAWQLLVHVCRRWRNLIFESPRRLNLRLFCTTQTPARNALDVWPPFPLLVWSTVLTGSLAGTDNVIAALEQSNRVCLVNLHVTGWKLEKVLAPMQVSFPELTDLRLSLHGEIPIIPDSFLGGSAPRLRFLQLDNIPFPGLPKLLLSTTHLVDLFLHNIPHSGYISPKAMVALLSALSSLEALHLGFESPQSRPHRETQSLPPPKRSVLTSLHEFRFKGITEYLEELITCIDTPQLEYMVIILFNQVDFDCPRLAQFINCTPILRAFHDAHVRFDDSTACVTLRYRESKLGHYGLDINILCREQDRQLSSIKQVCNFCLPPLPTIEDLYIEHRYSELIWKNETIDDTLWLELLLSFTAVKDLYISKEFAPGIAAALQALVGARIIDALATLQNIFVERLEPSESGPFQENIGQFVAARQLSNRPITISRWDMPEDQ